jgi:alpha/beta superfamily hydrolase
MEPVRFATEDHVFLEGELRVPEGEVLGSAVLCHPHPRHGGSKDHPILWAVRNELAHRGFAVLGFNFRGVMGSGGSYGGGRDELRDLRAAIGVARERAGVGPTFVCGWSFGASVALREALDDERVGSLALIGVPLDPKDVELPALPTPAELRILSRRPVLLIAGERDEYCPPELLRAFGSAFPVAEVAIVKDTDHYFWRRERELASTVAAFAERGLDAATR